VFLWFAGVAFVLVWLTFGSPALDYRLVVLGAVAPVAEVGVGPQVLHALVGPVVVLAVVMVVTRGRRLLRRRWLGLPIGLFVHLVADLTWADQERFWWPAFGSDLEAGRVPELERALGLILVLEVIGGLTLAWCWVRFGLTDPDRRSRFWHSGQLSRDLV